MKSRVNFSVVGAHDLAIPAYAMVDEDDYLTSPAEAAAAAIARKNRLNHTTPRLQKSEERRDGTKVASWYDCSIIARGGRIVADVQIRIPAQ